VLYDLDPVRVFPAVDKSIAGPVFVPEPSTVLLYDTQKILVRPSGGDDPSFETARWSDTLPKLLQARIVQSFENASFLGVVTKPIDTVTPAYQLLIDLRRFQISRSDQTTAELEFTAKIVAEDGKIVSARTFLGTQPVKATDPKTAVAALNEAFAKAVVELVVWTADTL
jgi:phospholipid/cholesterol/gamma-HCH transport system substrate-binding protein